ncbi:MULTISPECIES: PucR family transcriptional regulator [unclassified Leucobacter]|uniref:PucR family transcriptional regulator n=1 Tax=unclassified Leucobacter TaxID=2621730 RepID=UPI00165DD4A1|nr:MULTISPECIES: PucR family transcriptional regulator [unclassified Leucobacter]MBC9935830.1 PucR family transcriptional regulator [Leucobacter sp. cx-87]
MTGGHSLRPQLPSVAQVLQFDSLVAADPVVVAGAAGLTRTVRWMHVSELASIAGHLRGREMILTTGIALPDDDAGLRRFVAELARIDVSAIVIGLGPHFERSLPLAMMQAADEFALPLIVLRRHTAFVDVTEDVHARLVDSQIAQLQLSERIHETFSAMVLQGSSTVAILEQVSQLCGRPIVLENLNHELLEVFAGPRPRNDVIAEWAEHTRSHRSKRRTDYDQRTGWLVTTVGARSDDWGRLIIMSAADDTLPRGLEPDPLRAVQHTLIMLIERAASTIALGRLIERDRGVLQQQTHRSVLIGLLAGGGATAEAAREAAAIGVPIADASTLSIAIRGVRRTDGVTNEGEALPSIADRIRRKCELVALPFLGAQIDESVLASVISAPTEETLIRLTRPLLASFAEIDAGEITIAVSGPALGVAATAEALAEVLETAEAASRLAARPNPVRIDDLGLEGLLFSLAGDPKLRAFSRRALSALRAYDARHETALIDALRHFLFAGRNKSLAAKRAFVSRPWLYEQLERVETVLGIDLGDEAMCVQLQVAILSDDVRSRAYPSASHHQGES